MIAQFLYHNIVTASSVIGRVLEEDISIINLARNIANIAEIQY